MTNGAVAVSPTTTAPPPNTIKDTATMDQPDAMDGIEEAGPEDAAAISPDAIRKLANAHFAQGDYDTALPLYSMAIDGCREVLQHQDGAVADAPGEDEEPPSPLVVHLCNRSACLYRMERYDEALIDAAEAVQIASADASSQDTDSDGNASEGKGSLNASRDGHHHAKASFRLAKTQIQLGLGEDALRTTKDALERLDRLEEVQRNAGGSSNADGGDSNGDDANDGQPTLTTDEDDQVARGNTLDGQRKELERLLRHAEKVALAGQRKSKKNGSGTSASTAPVPPPQDLTVETRTPSIREFNLDHEIGQGNFSRVVICSHKVTEQRFALKIIEKKKVEQLAKRQHPNVYNEVKMERRVLEDRLPPPLAASDDPRRKHIVTLYHSFQDYNNLYFLQELHDVNGDLWSALRAQNKMVGTYPSLARRYAWELLDAIEYLHSNGIVHRDLKPENCLLDKNGHLVVLDFGTSKDMVWRDLNGPEFVGTADFMAPEMVKGVGDDVVAKAKAEGRTMEGGVDHTADLWAYGAVLFQLLVGSTPFAAPSPYLTFLRIQRGVLLRPWGVADDAAWDLIEKLMKVDPLERLGADGFDFSNDEEKAPDENSTTREERWKAARAIDTKSYGAGYDAIRQHPYFDPIREEMTAEVSASAEKARPIPSLRDLALRATAELVLKDSMDFDVEDNHPPGDGSSHDLLRLNPTDRKTLMHFLDKTNALAQPRVFRRFFKKKQEAKLGRVRPETRDYVGLSRLNDGQGNFPTKEAEEDPNHPTDFTKTGPIQVVYLWNPLFVKDVNENCNEDKRKEYISMLKDKLKLINKTRPKLVVASGCFDKSCLKLMGKINESIPVAINDGSCFFSTWTCGAQGLFLRSCDLLKDDWKSSDQMIWLKECLEQSKLTQHHVFVFVDCDPKLLPEGLLQRLHRGRTLCIFGPSGENDGYCQSKYECQPEPMAVEDNADDGDDDKSESSSTGNDPSHAMLLVGSGKSQLRILNLEEYGEYNADDV